MEITFLVLSILNILFTTVTIVLCLMVGSVVIQIMEVLRKLPDELRQPKKKSDGPPDRPWYTYV